MTQQFNDYLAGLASAQISLFGILAEHLDRCVAPGLKQEVAADLRRILDLAAKQQEALPECQRMIFEQVVAWLGRRERGWTPVVVRGSLHSRAGADAGRPSTVAEA